MDSFAVAKHNVASHSLDLYTLSGFPTIASADSPSRQYVPNDDSQVHWDLQPTLSHTNLANVDSYTEVGMPRGFMTETTCSA